MRRRLLLAATLLLSGAVCAGAGNAESDETRQALPHYTVSLTRIQNAMTERFPMRFPVQGLMNLDVQVPQLQLLPAQNRLGALAVVDAAGAALNRSHRGTLAMEFSLRYEASDRTVRAHQLRFNGLQFPTLQPGVVTLLNNYGQALSERTLLEVVVYRLRAQDLALPEGLGMQPGSITVTDAGLRIGFVPQALAAPAH
jgi:hypothetical protein